jgi:hypothetical protein
MDFSFPFAGSNRRNEFFFRHPDNLFLDNQIVFFYISNESDQGNPVKNGSCPATVIPFPLRRENGRPTEATDHEHEDWEGGRPGKSQETCLIFKSFEGRQMAPEFEKPAFPRKDGIFFEGR